MAIGAATTGAVGFLSVRCGLFNPSIHYIKETEMTKKMMVLSATLAMTLFGIADCAAQEYKIGDTGPAGGIVFWVRTDASKGEWRYLEAAPADFPKAEWGAYEKNIGGTTRHIGNGKKNTELIVAKLRELGETGKAAQLCDEYELNGYKDWFLPSRDELNLMYKNLQSKGLGNFKDNEWYWSSLEGDRTYAHYQCFYTNGEWAGYQSVVGKIRANPVRAIRAF
jgi:hypothetical protein